MHMFMSTKCYIAQIVLRRAWHVHCMKQVGNSLEYIVLLVQENRLDFCKGERNKKAGPSGAASDAEDMSGEVVFLSLAALDFFNGLKEL